MLLLYPFLQQERTGSGTRAQLPNRSGLDRTDERLLKGAWITGLAKMLTLTEALEQATADGMTGH
jgi:hypothetical protein